MLLHTTSKIGIWKNATQLAFIFLPKIKHNTGIDINILAMLNVIYLIRNSFLDKGQ